LSGWEGYNFDDKNSKHGGHKNMTIWWLVLILSFIGATGIAFIWLLLKLGNNQAGHPHHSANEALGEEADSEVERIFNSEFREELRNRGRLHFEKIIGENAMFLQQDLRLTTSQLNEYMNEFAKYEESITDAKQLAIDSIQKTNAAIDEQRQMMGQQVQSEITAAKEQMLARLDKNMTNIVSHYVLSAIGDQIDLNDQLEYILSDLMTNKQAILEDIRSGS
jgi:F0F1-type ATP synthase membrane subunit b/b'